MLKTFLALIEMESPELKKVVFSCYRKATKGSSLYSIEKHFFW